MADFNFNDLGEGLRTIFLAGVGAVATGAEKGQQIVDDLVKKGELTVDQGKVLNSELSRKAQGAAKDALSGAQDAAAKARETVDDVKEAALKARLTVMSDEERAAYVARVAALAETIKAEKAAKEAAAAASETATGDGEATPDAAAPTDAPAESAGADDDKQAE
ncbi:phasin family protein [Bifidobacterium sp. 82T24]|uniref:phasin family protein n=1 Tax=Bifidobacterium pluvialisilvae TaxID=2834436 RepID=UPI001C565CBF|nr:phasin family protein [Bifidobacterium pluvialisilvae]MBW3088313.1 phasin family protein [Bifidobacterium pluvialisilvae]